MRKLLISLLSVTPLFAMADAQYNIVIKNNRSTDIFVSSQDKICMDENLPDAYRTVSANDTLSFTILDSNPLLGSCSGANKAIKWYIYEVNKPNNFALLEFKHFKNIFNKWQTSVKPVNTGSKQMNVDARCGSDQWHCLSASDAANYPINITIK